MAQLLMEGSSGDEVKRLQKNLNEALSNTTLMMDGKNILPLETKSGVFGKRTKAAVIKFQTDWKLKSKNGVVGDETRAALATRAIIVKGTVTFDPNAKAGSGAPNGAPGKPAVTPHSDLRLTAPTLQVNPAAPKAQPAAHWLFQAQPALGIAPAPFNGSGGSSIYSGQLALGFVYRTKAEGMHWEIGCAVQPTVNTQNAPTDPRYTWQLQCGVTLADPYSVGRFHTALFGQALGLVNSPFGAGVGLQVGGQISLDIIENRLSLYSQAGVQVLGAWTLSGAPSDRGGHFSVGPVFTPLGLTIQFDVK